MKLIKTILLLIVICLMVAVMATCKKDANSQQDVDKADQDVTPAAAITWEQYRSDANARISTNETDIADYKMKHTDPTSGRFKASYNNKIEALEVKNHQVKVKLNAYIDDGKSSWADLKREIDSEIDALNGDITRFLAENDK